MAIGKHLHAVILAFKQTQVEIVINVMIIRLPA